MCILPILENSTGIFDFAPCVEFFFFIFSCIFSEYAGQPVDQSFNCKLRISGILMDAFSVALGIHPHIVHYLK